MISAPEGTPVAPAYRFPPCEGGRRAGPADARLRGRAAVLVLTFACFAASLYVLVGKARAGKGFPFRGAVFHRSGPGDRTEPGGC